jgi:hypothetical protein
VSRLTRNLALPALLICITVAFCWKLTLSTQYTWLNTGDDINQVAPWLQVQAAQWHSGHFPLWDTHQQAGVPLVGQVQPGTLNPLNWILFSMPLRDGFIQFASLNWYRVLIQFLGVLFGYILCRDLGLSPIASVLGGCAFGLSGFMGCIGWPQKMMSALLLPLILMFFLRVLRGEKVVANAAASGALLGASFLSGHHNVPIFFCLVMAGLWIYYFAAFRGAWTRKLVAAAAFAACFVLIAAAQIIPAEELGKLSLRWVNAPAPVAWDDTVPYSVHDEFSLYPTAILDIVIPSYHRPNFIGLVVVTLALFGAVTKWQEQAVRILSAIALAGLFLALGGHSLFHGVLYAVIPTLDKARSPDVAIAIFQLSMVVLAAFGLDSLRSSEVSHIALKIAVRVLSITALFLYASLILMINLRPTTTDAYSFLAEAALVALLLAGLLFACSKSRFSSRAAGTLVILLLLFEINFVTNSYQPMEKAGELHRLDDIAAFLKQKQDLPRVDVDEKEVSFDFGDWYGIDQLRGSLPEALKPFADMQGYPRFPRLLATNYFIGRNPKTPEQISAFEGRSGLHVFIDPSAFPRVRMAHAAVGVPDDDAVQMAVRDPATDLKRTVVLLGSAPALGNCEGGDDLDIPRYRPTSVVIRVNSPCRGMVILADAWFPGWNAYVDGKPAQIYRAYNLLRGVVVEGGGHEVVMLYRPASVFTGAVMAGLGILLCVVIQFQGRYEKLNRGRQEALPRTQN